MTMIFGTQKSCTVVLRCHRKTPVTGGRHGGDGDANGATTRKETGNCVIGRRHDTLTLIVAVTAALVLACGCCGVAYADPVSPAQVSAAVAAATGTVEKSAVETSPNPGTAAYAFNQPSSSPQPTSVDAATSADQPTESQTSATTNLQVPMAEDGSYHKLLNDDNNNQQQLLLAPLLMPSASLSTEWPSPPPQHQPMIMSVDGLAVIPSHAYVVGRERTEVEIVPVPSASEQHLFNSPLEQPEYSYIPVGNQEPAEQELQRIEPEQQQTIQSENSEQQLQDQQRTQVQPLQQQQIQDQQHTQVQQLQQQQTLDQQPTEVPQLQQQQFQDQQQMQVQQLQQQFQNQQQMQVQQVQQQQHHEVQQSTAAAPVDQKQYSYYYNNNNNNIINNNNINNNNINNNNINNNNKHDDDQQQQHSYHYYYQQNLVQQQQQLQLQQQQNNNNNNNVYNSVYSALPLPFGGVGQFNYYNNYGGIKYQPQPPHPLLQNHYHRGRQLMRRGSRSQQQVAYDNFYHHQHPQQPKAQSEYGAGGETDNVIGIKYDQVQQDQAGSVKQHQPGPPFRPSHPVWASQYPVPWTYYVKTSIVQPPLPPPAGLRYSQHGGGAAGNYYGGRKSRYVPVAGGAAVNRVSGGVYSAAAKTPRTKVVYIEYGGFKPKMVPSVQITASEDFAVDGTGNRRHSPAAAVADGGDDDGLDSETVVTVTQPVVPESTATDVGQRDNTATAAATASSSAAVVEVSASTTSIADTTSEPPVLEQQQQPEPEQPQQPAAGVVVVVV